MSHKLLLYRISSESLYMWVTTKLYTTSEVNNSIWVTNYFYTASQANHSICESRPNYIPHLKWITPYESQTTSIPHLKRNTLYESRTTYIPHLKWINPYEPRNTSIAHPKRITLSESRTTNIAAHVSYESFLKLFTFSARRDYPLVSDQFGPMPTFWGNTIIVNPKPQTLNPKPFVCDQIASRLHFEGEQSFAILTPKPWSLHPLFLTNFAPCQHFLSCLSHRYMSHVTNSIWVTNHTYIHRPEVEGKASHICHAASSLGQN